MNVRPYVCAPIQFIDPGIVPNSPAEFKSLHKVSELFQKTIAFPLTFVPLDFPPVKLVHISDAIFSNARDLRIQLGCVIALVYTNGRENVVHYGSIRCRSVVRCVMVAEFHALVFLGFDNVFIVRQLQNEILGRSVAI